ncbi:S1/P1 Nuclease [Propionivibrio dicarboxylicus]|uniref:S1/P1 Nuclease n=2 Tax=Propionivibrio dicarboxylicus TaxID=83767 RepID=A0A1G7W7Y9_9RHOO|nr:S1/P1 Nuclease [Propionivibrio dicarboxylicus]
MTPSARQEAARLLDAHPDRTRWQAPGGETPDARQTFIAASTWPDEIRHDPRFFTQATEAPTPLLAGFPDMERHTSWHTLARPLDAPAGQLSPNTTSENLGTAIATQCSYFEYQTANAATRTYALPWLIHLVGDAHQPLHVSLRLDTNGEWDGFGTQFRVRDPAGARKSPISLHSYWDDLGGPRKLHGNALDTAIDNLIAHHPQSAMDAEAPAPQWLDESWRAAQANAYPASNDDIAVIDDDFRERSRAIAERRITQAGYRLGRLLNRLLDGPGIAIPQ